MRPTSLCLCVLEALVAGLGQGLRRGRAWTEEMRRTYKLELKTAAGLLRAVLWLAGHPAVLPPFLYAHSLATTLGKFALQVQSNTGS
jgi:hypothetical protein